MQPLNPYLRAFFRSALPSQCLPPSHHVLLVPTTDVLLTAREQESASTYADLAGTEDFLASHVVRIPGGVAAGKDGAHLRESKTKARQFSTINGRTVVIKDTFVYSNKGFKTLNQAQLLSDTLYYPDASDGQQWLVYFISKPLVGVYHPCPIRPAVISDEPSRERRDALLEASSTTSSSPRTVKKDIKDFPNLLAQFPLISRHIQPGLEKIVRDFLGSTDTLYPNSRSRSSSVSSRSSIKSAGSSVASIKSSLSGDTTVHPTMLELEPEEQILRNALGDVAARAIELFQSIDKSQLAQLGTQTDLTGPMIERMIERYVSEQVHDQAVFRKICTSRKPEDSDLDLNIRKMSDIDIAQVGIAIDDGMTTKRQLAIRLNAGVERFQKMGLANSPQEMLEILVETQKALTFDDPAKPHDSKTLDRASANLHQRLTMNADVLVSILMVVVIRSGIKHLYSRLLYMRYFIFVDEVDSGEQGYALATLEAVLAHLSGSSNDLTRASKRNRLLWQAVKLGDVQALEVILDSQSSAAGEPESPALHVNAQGFDDENLSSDTIEAGAAWTGTSQSLLQSAPRNYTDANESLHHVFPFQKPPTPPPDQTESNVRKRVSMASLPGTHSACSVCSSRSHSRNKSMDSNSSAFTSGEISVDGIAHSQDGKGNSILMMAVESERMESLKFLLNLPAHFRADFVLDDVNDDGTTLLSAAMQSGNERLTDELINYLETHASEEDIVRYIQLQDAQGRCMAHYLFNQPRLIRRFGKLLPWRLKDKNGQTPLFALCRSYDHEEYYLMVTSALGLAAQSQGDGQALHLDDHVDAKGNTLLHIVHDMSLTMRLLRNCDSDVNAANDKRFTPLMVGSKYGRVDLVRALFADPRVDTTLRDIRGLTAVELAKDDEMRNRIDDLVLLSSQPGRDGRITTIVRSFFVEDATVRLVLKSGLPNASGTVTITTCRRSVADFENLAKWLALECPASWLPTQFHLQSPYLIPSKPSKAVLRDTQIRLDNFLRSLLSHGTFSTHELVWEFFLVPDMDAELLAERTQRKAEVRVENVREEYEPVTDTQEVENFVAFARDQMRGVTNGLRKALRSVNKIRMLHSDLHEAKLLAASAVSSLLFLPQPYISAYDRFAKAAAPSDASPMANFYYSVHSTHTTSAAIQAVTNRPAYLIGSMIQAQRAIDQSKNSVSRSNRWTPKLGLFEDTRRAVALQAWDKAAKARRELENLGSELRYTQQTIANDLAAWQDDHVVSGRAMLRRLATETIVKERARLESLKRALRLVQ